MIELIEETKPGLEGLMSISDGFFELKQKPCIIKPNQELEETRVFLRSQPPYTEGLK